MAEGNEGAASGDAGNEGAADKTFSQADVDKIVQNRLAKETKKFGDYEDLKARAAKADELEAAQRTDAEKQAARTAELERKDATNTTAVQEARLENAVLRSAGKVGIVDPDAAVKLLDHSAIEYDSDGKPTNIEKLLKQLIEERPYLADNATRTTSFDGGARTTASGNKQSPDGLIRQMAGQ